MFNKWPLSLGLILFPSILWCQTHIALNWSASEPPGLYRITHEPVTRGKLVLLRNPLKEIVGVPGDWVRFAPDGVYVNGQLIPHSAVPKGSPYPHYPYMTIKLAEDQFLVMGSHPLSWDARYEGVTPASLLQTTVEPLWTTHP